MIKKALFADELAAEMQKELYKIASGQSPDLIKAGEYLHSALEILEDTGLQKHADQVLGILEKIAIDPNAPGRTYVKQMPTLAELMKHGLTHKDLQQFGKGDYVAKAKLNRALRNMGMSDKEIASFLGAHNVIPEGELKSFDPKTSLDNINEMIAEEIKPPPEDIIDPTIPQELEFKSIAARPRKPGRPDKIRDVHTKNLTPEKEVKNFEHHGTPFNMPDLGWASFDPEAAHALDAEISEDLNNIDDLLDADLFDADALDETNESLQDFEDEITSRK